MNRTIDTEYREVVDQLLDRWPDANVVPSLDRERRLVDMMGTPQLHYPVIHIGGTNGKSSTTRMVDSLLRAMGLRVGRFTSPDFSLSERVAIDGSPVGRARFVELYREVAPYVAIVDQEFSQRLTAFEVITAMAFAAFSDAPVDVAAIEVGMGGAWDCTNVVESSVAAITPIALDHQEYLGDTIGDIATEKAGIVKAGSTVIVAEQSTEALRPILERCAEVGATIAREGSEFGVLHRAVAVGGQVLTLQGLGEVYEEVFLPLHGAHQAQNAAVALAATEAFLGASASGKALDAELVRAGFAAAAVPGRLERVRSAPTVLLDPAHNPHGMAATVAALAEDFGFRRLVAVVAMFEDKDAAGVLELLEPVADAVVVTRNSGSRSMPPARLGAIASEIFGEERVSVAPHLPDAIETAVVLAEADLADELGGVGVLITGSVVTVADARRLLIASI